MTPKTYAEFAASIIDTLESLELVYAIGGSFASNTYGETRTTVDIGISIMLPASDVKRFVDAIRGLGYYIDTNAIVDAMVYKMPFNIMDTHDGYKAKA